MLASRLLVALAAAFLVWLALPGTFVFDDHSLFVDPAVAPLDAWRQWVALAQTRQLTYLTFWADYHLWGASAAGFRLTNLLIHLGAAWLVFLCGRRLMDDASARVAALLFALHPLAHEPLLYVFARSSSLAAVFSLMAVWLWLGERRWAAVGWFGVGLLAKEEWVALPVVLLGFDWVKGRGIAWRPLAVMAGCAAVAGARVIYATKAIAGAGSGFGQSTTPWEYFLLQGQAIPGYLWRVVAPVRITIDPARPELPLGLGLLGWAGLGALLWWTWKKWGWVAAAIVLLLPGSSILPAADAVAFRRMYLPMAALAMGGAVLLRGRPRVTLAVLGLLGLFAAVRRETWRSEAALWREAMEQAPGKARPYIQLARVSAPGEALGLLRRAGEIAPGDAEVASERGRVWLESGDAAQALAEFGRALAMAPQEARHLQNRGVSLAALGQAEAARADFLQALEKNPCLGPARENLRRMGVEPPLLPSTCPTISSTAK